MSAGGCCTAPSMPKNADAVEDVLPLRPELGLGTGTPGTSSSSEESDGEGAYTALIAALALAADFRGRCCMGTGLRPVEAQPWWP